MRIALLTGTLVLGGLTFAAHPAAAQGFDERCLKIVETVCGGAEIGKCFRKKDIWELIPSRCTGDVQSMVEMDREAREQQRNDRAAARASGRRSGPSFSCGGVLRSRPAMNSGKVASVAEGQELESVEDVDVWFNDYKWFRVRYNGLVGYHWGGIFWTQGGREGTIPSCNG